MVNSTLGHHPHSFHIPVMGTGFTIDTPLKVARYGISSVIMIGDDVLIEQMRKHHCENAGEPYVEIRAVDEDSRARRITAYLNLIDRLVRKQVTALQASAFGPGTEITRYFRLLPEGPLKQAYFEMKGCQDQVEKRKLEDHLRRCAVPGAINVNIMTKLNRDTYRKGRMLPPEFGEALAALRGYAHSNLRSSIIFSAGINQRLYGYMEKFDDFFPNEEGQVKKKIVLKVTDFRSAQIQGRYLAKRGLWISEYRVESGLNCGGHAFATKGVLLGPTLDEFQKKGDALNGRHHDICAKALVNAGRPAPRTPMRAVVSVQGGIGTAPEDEFLREYFEVEATGWGTPFLLVPEVTNVDEVHLQKLATANENDVFLSDASPIGTPVWNLRDSLSEQARMRRNAEGKSGIAFCKKGFFALNTEFSKVPICPATRVYQKQKLTQLKAQEDSGRPYPKRQRVALEMVLAKSCVCHDLAGGATLKHNIDPAAQPAVICGPNIVNFSGIYRLEEMVDHIYGRAHLITNSQRPNMFLKELGLYLDHFEKETVFIELGLANRSEKYLDEFRVNVLEGVAYYRRMLKEMRPIQRNAFRLGLEALQRRVECLMGRLLPEFVAPQNEATPTVTKAGPLSLSVSSNSIASG